jgi:hypothetical protein
MQMYAGISCNKMLDEPNDKGETMPVVEVIILAVGAEYQFGPGGVSKSHKLNDFRFVASCGALRELAEKLNEMADDADAMAARAVKGMALMSDAT